MRACSVAGSSPAKLNLEPSVVKGFAKHLQRGGIEVARAFDHPSRFHHSLSKFVVTSVRGYQIGLTRYEA
jgi:hypothetical protein